MTGSQISALALGAAFTGLMYALACLLAEKMGVTQDRFQRRLFQITNRPKAAIYSYQDQENKRKNARRGKNKRRLVKVWGNRLAMADMSVRPEEFLLLWLLLAVGPGGLTLLLSGALVPALTLALLGAVGPLLYVKRRLTKRTAVLESQLGDALIIISNCIRSGLTFQQALETGAEQMTPPISQEFARVVKEMHYGNTLERAMGNMADRVNSQDLVLVVSAVSIQRQTGGNLSAILETISGTIKERQKLRDDIRVLTATGRISGLVIGLLPVGMALILLLMNPAYMMGFFQSQLGAILMVVAAIMECIGFLVVRKIINIKY